MRHSLCLHPRRKKSTDLDKFGTVFRSEGRVAAEEGVGDDTDAPHIYRFAMSLTIENLYEKRKDEGIDQYTHTQADATRS